MTPEFQTQITELLAAGNLEAVAKLVNDAKAAADKAAADAKDAADKATRDTLLKDFDLGPALTLLTAGQNVGLRGIALQLNADGVVTLTPLTRAPVAPSEPGVRAAAGTGTFVGDKATYDGLGLTPAQIANDLAEMKKREAAGVRSFQWHTRADRIKAHRAGKLPKWEQAS
jgi:hypothetical protein